MSDKGIPYKNPIQNSPAAMLFIVKPKGVRNNAAAAIGKQKAITAITKVAVKRAVPAPESLLASSYNLLTVVALSF